MTEEKFINDLKQKNKEYAEISFILESYQKYLSLFNNYFCNEKRNNEDGSIEFVFSEKLMEENVSFLEKWPLRLQKINDRLKKNKYKSRGGRFSDEKEIKKCSEKFDELKLYFILDKEFFKIEQLQDYIERIRSRKLIIEQMAQDEGLNNNHNDENQPQ